MDAVAVAQRYIAAWNEHDAGAINAVFAAGGTYEDPASGGPLTGEAIGAYAQGLIDGIPDLKFDVVSVGESAPGLVALQWLARGVNSGSMQGLPPSGHTVALPGVDIISVEDSGVRSVIGYFDRQQFSEQLGLDVITQPHEIGPFKFGTGTYLDLGRRTRPGAFSLTAIQLNSEDELAELGERSQQVLMEMMQMPGVISVFAGGIGARGFTITAWESAEAPRRLMAGGAHGEAMQRFFGDEFAAGGVTMVFVPERINTMWVRCTKCRSMESSQQPEGACSGCGTVLPEHPAYW